MSHPKDLITPQPSRVTELDGRWGLTSRNGGRLVISARPELAVQAGLLGDYLKENLFSTIHGQADEADIHLELSLPPRTLPARLVDAGFADERYRLRITPERITLSAASPNGIAMGIQSLRQLLSGQRGRLDLAGMEIEDEPAMNWRGIHLDASRHFWSADVVKRFIDLAALHKMNLFHWHLTDDQGWRLPVHGYPKLLEIAAWRDATMVGPDSTRAENPVDGIRHGGFYSHEEIREVVAFAAARGIQVLPEVDVPGHVQALVAAYPELGCVSEKTEVRQCWGISPYVLNPSESTFEFLGNVIATVADLFPFRYIHLGGDEAQTDQWAASEQVQQQKAALGLPSDRAIQEYFTVRLARLLRTHEKLLIGWDEIIEDGTPEPETVIMNWRPDFGFDRKALEMGHGLVLADSSHTYFDHYQVALEHQLDEPLAIGGCTPLEKVYGWNPFQGIPAPLHAGIFGAQAQIWTEYVPNRNALDYMVYPRLCALAQVLWSGSDRETFEGFVRRLKCHLARLDRLGVSYRPLDD